MRAQLTLFVVLVTFVAVGLAYLGVRVLRLSDQRFEHGSDPR